MLASLPRTERNDIMPFVDKRVDFHEMNFQVIPADTTPEAARIEADVYRRMPPEKRLAMALQMSDFLRALVAAGVRDRHPEFTPRQLQLAVARLYLGDELFQKAFAQELKPR
jgi:hypothetical protein